MGNLAAAFGNNRISLDKVVSFINFYGIVKPD